MSKIKTFFTRIRSYFRRRPDPDRDEHEELYF